MTTEKIRTTIYLEDGLKKKVKKLAAIRNRSFNNLIETLLLDEINKADKEGELE